MDHSSGVCDVEKFLCVISGPIGAGKTTYIKFLKNMFNTNKIGFVDEDVTAWKAALTVDENGKQINLFDAYYEDTVKYAFEFQKFVLESRIEKLQEALKNYNIVVCERSPDDDWYVFTKYLSEDGKMSENEKEIFWHMWNERWADKYKIDLQIYLDVPVDTCFNRIKIRNRGGEGGITKKFLNSLDTCYRAFIDGNNNNTLTVKLGCDVNSTEYTEALQQVFDIIKDKI